MSFSVSLRMAACVLGCLCFSLRIRLVYVDGQ